MLQLEANVVAYMPSHNPPEYDNPPVNEVVCGILFRRIDEFLNPFLGVLWEKYKPEYMHCREVAPILPIIESFDRPIQPEPQFIDVDAPLLPRTWFVHGGGNGVIQIQRDRFHHNWWRVQPDDEYPRYEHVVSMFRSHLSTFI
jgi:hypothetical protein